MEKRKRTKNREVEVFVNVKMPRWTGKRKKDQARPPLLAEGKQPTAHRKNYPGGYEKQAWWKKGNGKIGEK